jgi:hypothetical protein
MTIMTPRKAFGAAVASAAILLVLSGCSSSSTPASSPAPAPATSSATPSPAVIAPTEAPAIDQTAKVKAQLINQGFAVSDVIDLSGESPWPYNAEIRLKGCSRYSSVLIAFDGNDKPGVVYDGVENVYTSPAKMSPKVRDALCGDKELATVKQHLTANGFKVRDVQFGGGPGASYAYEADVLLPGCSGPQHLAVRPDFHSKWGVTDVADPRFVDTAPVTAAKRFCRK